MAVDWTEYAYKGTWKPFLDPNQNGFQYKIKLVT